MISVVMTTYNGEKYIEKQLISIANQTCCADEVIICDDCSTDETVSKITAFIQKNSLSTWHIYCNSLNFGFVKNFFSAINRAKGDLIFLADQDDIWLSHKIERMSQIVYENKEIKLLFSELEYIDKNDAIISKKHIHVAKLISIELPKPPVYPLGYKKYCKTGGYQGMGMAFRKELLSSLVNVDLNHVVSHDSVLGFAASCEHGMYICREVLNQYRLHENNAIGANQILKGEKTFRLNVLKVLIKTYTSYLQISKKAEIQQYTSALIQIYEKRYKNLNDRNFVGAIGMIRYIVFYPSLRTYLGDIAFVIKDR